MFKNNTLLPGVIVLTLILISMLFIFTTEPESKKNIDFLKGYGWEVDKEPVEKVEIYIPEVFDDVYKNYNKLQIEAGLDLTPYAGYKAIRYTYKLKNFPEETKSEVFANVLTIDGTPVAGDICTYALDGFMYSLNFNTKTCFKISDINILE